MGKKGLTKKDLKEAIEALSNQLILCAKCGKKIRQPLVLSVVDWKLVSFCKKGLK